MTHTADDMHDDSPVTPAPVGEVLLPCPFCGAEAYVEWNRSTGSMFSVQCTRCAAEGPINAVEADAVTAWNRRAPPSDTSGEAVALIDTALLDFNSALAAAEARGVQIGLERAAEFAEDYPRRIVRGNGHLNVLPALPHEIAKGILALSPAHKGSEK